MLSPALRDILSYCYGICAESAVKPQENKRTLLLPGVNFETGQVGWTSRKECCILWRRSHPKHTGSDAWHVWLW